MVWDVVSSDGFDHTNFESSSDPLFEENNVVSSMARSAERGECLKIDGGAVVPKDLAEREGNVLKEASSAIGKKAENIKNDFLKSSPKESNAAAGIWKCEKVPSENLIDKRAIFVIKKDIVRFCKNLPPNVLQEGKGCYPSSKVLETLTKKVLPFFKARKCNSCEISKIRVNDLVKCLGFKKEDLKKKDKEYRYLTRRLYDVLNVFKGINYNKSGNQVSVEGHARSKNGRKAKSLAAIANKICMKIKNMKKGDILKLKNKKSNNKLINENFKTKVRRVYDVMEVLTGLEMIEKSGKNCYVIKKTEV